MLLDLIFPKICSVCHKPGSYLCTMCKAKLKPYTEVCSLCNRYCEGYHICALCKKQYHFKLEQIIIGFYYDSIIKKLILDLKYRHRYDVADFLAERLQRLIEIYIPLSHSNTHSNSNNNPDTTISTAIMGVPSHWWRKYVVKGYNQSEILAQHIAKKMGLLNIHPLKKIRNTKSQVKLNKAQRMKNLNNSFKLVTEHSDIFSGITHIIIVDDITTTGSSLNTVAQTIKYHYPQMRISGIVLAKK